MRRIPAFVVFLDFVVLRGLAQPVIIYDKPETNLADRWSWAQRESGGRKFSGGFWVAYSIERLMDENSFIASGMHFNASLERKTTMYDLFLKGTLDTSAPSGLVTRRKNKSSGLSMMNSGRKSL